MHATLIHSRYATYQRPPTESRDPHAAEVASRLAASGYPALRAIHCRSHDGVMILSGTVSSYYLKQIAQTVAAQADTVSQVDNQLKVRSVR